MAPTTGTVRPCPVCLHTRLLLLLITLVNVRKCRACVRLHVP